MALLLFPFNCALILASLCGGASFLFDIRLKHHLKQSMLNISKAPQPNALEWRPSHLNMSPWLQIPTHFRSIGAQEPRDWLADQQQTSLLATRRGVWPVPQSTNVNPNSKKGRLLFYNYHQGFEGETQVKRIKIKQQIASGAPQQSSGINIKRYTWYWAGQGLVSTPTTIGIETNITEQISTLFIEMRNVGPCWREVNQSLAGGGLTEECTVHNPLNPDI